MVRRLGLSAWDPSNGGESDGKKMDTDMNAEMMQVFIGFGIQCSGKCLM